MSRALEVAVVAASLSCCAALLVAVGQPIFTDDIWWHLAMGEAYAGAGPWLDHDPMLHTATGPPSPAAWGSDIGLYLVQRASGFGGLRVFHVLSCAAILAIVAVLARRSRAGMTATGLALAGFASLAGYRLVQLRPHLATIALALALAWLLFPPTPSRDGADDGEGRGATEDDRAPREPPSWTRVIVAALLMGLWAQLHSGFLLGPLLVLAAVAGLVVASALRPDHSAAAADRARALRLAAAFALGLLATFANPVGIEHHLAYFSAGAETPSLGVVTDEWAPVRPFAWPVSNLPPYPFTWLLLWGLGVSTLVCALRSFAAWRRGDEGLDPVWLALSAAAFLALLSAVRFVWLAVFALLLLLQAWPHTRRASRRFRYGAASAAVLSSIGFFVAGPWPMISAGIPRSLAGYAQPFSPARYYAHPVWMARDAGLEGRLFNQYFQGNFLGYWLGPQSRAFVNGSLNLPVESMEASHRLAQRAGMGSASFAALLDRFEVDLFLGIRAPAVPPPNRSWIRTTGHLEGVDGWRLVFRDLRSDLYLRDTPRNADNLARAAAWYAAQQVPFDPSHGLDVAEVLREAPEWAARHGMIPVGYGLLQAQSRDGSPSQRNAALRELAKIAALLGLYEEAAESELRLTRRSGEAHAASRRLVWNLLRLDRTEEAVEASRALEPQLERDDLARILHEAAGRLHATEDAEERARLRSQLPLLAREDLARILSGVIPPAPRDSR